MSHLMECCGNRRFTSGALTILALLLTSPAKVSGGDNVKNSAQSAELKLTLRSRIESSSGSGPRQEKRNTVQWQAKETAIIVVDMWDDHHCFAAARRVTEMAPHMNDALKSAREQGVLVIHAPSDCMDFYKDTPQRRRAQAAAFKKAPVEFKWNNLNPKREGLLADYLAKAGCACDTKTPCRDSFRAWKRQIDKIDIAPGDAISDKGQEVYNLLEERGIDNIIVMGVHTNLCVLGRPFGIRQMVYLGKNTALCRDLTDSYHRDPGRHFEGLDRILEHVETYWCPTFSSTDFTGRLGFQFKEATQKKRGEDGTTGTQQQ